MSGDQQKSADYLRADSPGWVARCRSAIRPVVRSEQKSTYSDPVSGTTDSADAYSVVINYYITVDNHVNTCPTYKMNPRRVQGGNW